MNLSMPSHISELVRALANTKDTSSVLLHFDFFLIDPFLYSIYLDLGYNPSCGSFSKNPEQSQVLKRLFDEYSSLKVPLKRTLSDSDSSDKPRNAKGLKVLSARVKTILIGKRLSSYRQVAEELIKDMNIVNKAEEKNILRRVYDALNVLIASGVVVKHGKDYCWKSVGRENVIRCKEVKVVGNAKFFNLAPGVLTVDKKGVKNFKMQQDEDKVFIKFE